MGEIVEQPNLQRLIRRYWWAALIVMLLLICLCTATQAAPLLSFITPLTDSAIVLPTEEVTSQPPTEIVTEQPTELPTDKPTQTVTEPPPLLTEEPTEPPTDTPTEISCYCEGADLYCSDGWISYNSTRCGGNGGCNCREPDKALACADGTYAPFNPACGVGGTTDGGDDACSMAVCGYGICQPECGETYPPCLDCIIIGLYSRKP